METIVNELSIRVTERTEINGRAVERIIDIETIAPIADAVGISQLIDATEKVNSRIEAASAAMCGEAPERFRKIFDRAGATAHSAVLDQTIGLMWSVESLGNPDDEDDGTTQEHCIERCKQLRLLGYDDWRLSTRSELVTLIDDTRRDPAIDIDLFPRVKPRRHWTSTAVAGSSASAWLVHFYDGGVDGDLRGYDGFALAVRRAGQ